MKKFSAIVIAAGRGKRMRSKTAKALHPVAGRPLLWYMVSLAGRVADARVAVVIGNQADRVRAFLDQSKAEFEPFDVCLQRNQLGTGHAVKQAQSRADAQREGREQALPDPERGHAVAESSDRAAVVGPS